MTVSKHDGVRLVRWFMPSLLVLFALWAQVSFPQLIAVQRYILLYPAIVFGALIGGGGPGFAAGALAAVGAWYWFVPDERSFVFGGTARDLLGFLVFCGSSVGITLLGSKLRWAHVLAREVALRSHIADQLRIAQQIAHIGTFDLNLQTGANSWTPELEKMYGLPAGGFTGTLDAWKELVHPEDRARAAGAVELALATGEPVEEEWRVVWADGSVHWLTGRFQALRDKSGRPRRLTGANIDITKRKQVELELKDLTQNLEEKVRERTAEVAERDERLRFALNAAQAGTWDWKVEGDAVEWDQEMYPIYGVTPETFQPSYAGFLAFVHPEDRESMDRCLREAVEKDLDFERECRIVRRDGSVRYVMGRGKCYRDASGRPTRMLGICWDVTQRKQEELARLAERKQAEAGMRTLAAVAESSNDFIGVCDPEMRPVYLNEAGMRMVGLDSMEQVKKTRVLDYFWPGDRNRIEREAIPELSRTGRWSGVCRFRNFKTGELIHTIWNAFLIKDAEGKVTGWATVSPNLNQLKASEDKIRAALAEKEVLLREIHHRVKNNLNVISSLLELQAMGMVDQQVHDAFLESQNRVMSMALIHEKLYQSKDIARLDFGNYVQDLVQCIYHTYGKDPAIIRPEIRIGKVELDIDTAIPCSLIINELVSNSLKHAFPGGRAGHVAVSLQSLGEDSAYLLEVEDDGVGFPKGFVPAQARSLGLKLVDSLARQLGGDLTQDASRPGADCRIRFNVRKSVPLEQ